MVKHQIITGVYNNKGLFLFTRDEHGKRHDTKVLGEEPHFWLPVDTKLPYDRERKITKSGSSGWVITRVEDEPIPSIGGKKLKKVFCGEPSDVGNLNKFWYNKDGTYEADIVFVRRMMIDQGLTSGIELKEGQEFIHKDRIKPIDFTYPPRFILADTEEFSTGRFPNAELDECPLIINCMYDSWSDRYASMVVDPKGKENSEYWLSENHLVHIYPSEMLLLNATKYMLKKADPDIYSAWFVSFDREYQDTRCERYKIKLPWERTNVFDLLDAYKYKYTKGSNKLEDVVLKEELDIPNYELFDPDMWKNDLDRAILVNKSHVEAIVELNKKYSLIDLYWEMKNFSGFEEMKPTLWHGAVIERKVLSKYLGKFILPSRPNDEEIEFRKEEYDDILKGGKVFIPPIGLWDDVANYDLTRYYLEILIAKNISPEPHDKDELGVYPKLAIECIKNRLIYDNQLKDMVAGTDEHSRMKTSRLVVKDTSQSIFGSLGDPKGRLFYPDGFNEITETGQRGLLFLKSKAESDGYKFLYGDTDSILIKIPFEKAEAYAKTLNKYLVEFSRSEGIDRNLSLKLDRYYKRIIFKRKKGTTHGAKKRYASHVCFEDGKTVDYIYVRGFENVRRDASVITKKIQMDLFEILLRGDPETAKGIVRGYVKTMLSGDFSIGDMAIPKTLHKRPEKYPRPQDYVRGAIYSNKWLDTGIVAEDMIKVIYLSSIEKFPNTDVISLFSFKNLPMKFTIDLEKTVEKTIKNKTEELLELVGISWKETVSPNKKLSEVLG